ncbi:MAG: DinB family protein [Phycisphaerales bacterium]|nr:DinB family protein [Phycisphaerales bacterium]
MTAVEMLTQTLQQAHQMLNQALADFSDADLLVRPVPGANHAAWQLTHIIAAEVHMMSATKSQMPSLPPDFASKANKEGAALNSPADFLNKAQFLALIAHGF